MKKIVTLLVCLLPGIAAFAQDKPVNKIRLSIVSGLGRSTFVYGKHGYDSNFPSAEIRLGMGLTRVILKNFEIKSGLLVGVKLKRKPVGGVLPPFQDLDEVTSGINHWFYEIPILFQYNLKKEIMGQPNFFGIRAGMNYRLFWDRGANDQDFLQNRSDFGVIIGTNFNISKRICLGIDYCMGITKITGGTTFTGGPPPTSSYTTIARNNFIQLKMEYRLKKE